MRPLWHRTARGLLLALSLSVVYLLSPLAGHAGSRNKKAKIPAVRWDEGRPGCTFSRGNDGRSYYGLWYEDAGITLAVDSQELEKVHRRH